MQPDAFIPSQNTDDVPSKSNGTGDIATISDRRVRLVSTVATATEPPTLYQLCRQWVYNNPNAVYKQSIENTTAIDTIINKLPPLSNHSIDTNTKAPSIPLSTAMTILPQTKEDTASILHSHQQRWRAAGLQMREDASLSRKAYEERLVSLTSRKTTPPPAS